MKLQIDFVSQQGNASRNDCGPACVAMLAGVTIEKVMQAVAHPPGEMMPLCQNHAGGGGWFVTLTLPKFCYHVS